MRTCAPARSVVRECRISEPGWTSVDGSCPSTSSAYQRWVWLRSRLTASACPRQPGSATTAPHTCSEPARAGAVERIEVRREPTRVTCQQPAPLLAEQDRPRSRLTVGRGRVESPVRLGEPAPELVRAALGLGLGRERVLDVRVPVVQAVGELVPGLGPVQLVAVRAAAAAGAVVQCVRHGEQRLGVRGRRLVRAAPAVGPGALRAVDLQRGGEVGEDRFGLDRLFDRGPLGPQGERMAAVREVEQVGAGALGPVAPADLRERPAQPQGVENLLAVGRSVVQCHWTGLLPCDRGGQAVAVVTSPCSWRS